MTAQQAPTALVPTPGILLVRPRRERRHPRLGAYLAFALIAVAGLALLAWEVLSGFPYVVEFWGTVELPAALLYAVVALIGVGGVVTTRLKPLAPWYQPWSFVEYLDGPDGLRVFAGRNGDQGFPVRPGEVLRIDAVPRRQGRTKIYELTVSAEAGEHTMTVPTFLHRLTMVPLVEAARARDIDVVRYGDAGQIEHPAPRGE